MKNKQIFKKVINKKDINFQVSMNNLKKSLVRCDKMINLWYCPDKDS